MRSTWLKNIRKLPGTLFLLALAFVVLMPIIYIICASFKTNAEIMTSPDKLLPIEFTVQNYIELFTTDSFNFWRYLFNSCWYSAVTVTFSVISSMMSAYAFERGTFPLKNFFDKLFSAMLFVQLGGVTIYALFEILDVFNLSGSIYGLVVVKFFSINIVQITLLKSYLRTIPRELDEAAIIDGCSVFRSFWQITVPLLKPIIATLVILSFKTSWNEYIAPQIYTASRPDQRTLTVGIMALKNSGQGAASNNLLLAGTVMSLVPVLIVYILCNKHFVKGLAAGAVKG